MNSLKKYGYSLQNQIGKGSFSSVLKAKHIDEVSGKETLLACKRVDKKNASQEFVEKFFPRELEIIMKLSHPNIIAIRSILENCNLVYIFMRWAENGDLLMYLGKHSIVTEHQASFWFYQIVSAVKYLHEAGYAHRDLKCENVLITKNMNVKITDFGLSRYCLDKDMKKINSNTYCGSESYVAPEVIMQISYDPMISDVWSLGVICFVMLYGTLPFDFSNAARLLSNQFNLKFHYPKKPLQKPSIDALSMIQDLLKPDPENRLNINQVYNHNWIREHSIKN